MFLLPDGWREIAAYFSLGMAHCLCETEWAEREGFKAMCLAEG